MIEPTETETPETLDEFCETMMKIAQEINTKPDFVKGAPYTTPVRRLDEVRAARDPQLRWPTWEEPQTFSNSAALKEGVGK